MPRTIFFNKIKQEKRNMIELFFVCSIIGRHGSLEEELVHGSNGGEHNSILSVGKFCLYSVAFLNFKLAER